MLASKAPTARVLEHRNRVFSIGALDGAVTLPNLLGYMRRSESGGGGGDDDDGGNGADPPISKWPRLPHLPNPFTDSTNPLLGAATSVTAPLSRGGSKLDVAVSGAVAQDLTSQARLLAAKLRVPPYASKRGEWKLLTLFIGANNVCRACQVDAKWGSAVTVVGEVREALETLIEAAGARWVVNLVGLPRVRFGLRFHSVAPGWLNRSRKV